MRPRVLIPTCLLLGILATSELVSTILDDLPAFDPVSEALTFSRDGLYVQLDDRLMRMNTRGEVVLLEPILDQMSERRQTIEELQLIDDFADIVLICNPAGTSLEIAEASKRRVRAGSDLTCVRGQFRDCAMHYERDSSEITHNESVLVRCGDTRGKNIQLSVENRCTTNDEGSTRLEKVAMKGVDDDGLIEIESHTVTSANGCEEGIELEEDEETAGRTRRKINRIESEIATAIDKILGIFGIGRAKS